VLRRDGTRRDLGYPREYAGSRHAGGRGSGREQAG
jgi:hypothetical protein